jgi:RND family efflux transporter MFP subunit
MDPEAVRFRPEVVATGYLKPLSQALLAMSLPGTLDRVLVHRGDVVRAGTILAVLDDAAARAQLAQAEAGIAAAQAQLALAEDGLARVKRLRAEESASESQLNQAQAQRDLALAQADAARAQRDQAAVQLRYQSLRAPFDGVVIKVPDGVGFAVGPAVPLFALESTSTLVLETSLTQEEVVGLAAGARARVLVPATGATTDEARVRVIVPSVDPATNRVPVELTVDNRDGRFLAHAFARAQLGAVGEVPAWRVPSAALTQREGAFSVWIAGGDGKARTVRVRVFRSEGDRAVVDPGGSGWPQGARVVVTPPLGLVEGAAVGGKS